MTFAGKWIEMGKKNGNVGMDAAGTQWSATSSSQVRAFSVPNRRSVTCLHAALPLSGLDVPISTFFLTRCSPRAETSLMFFVISSLPCYHPLQGSVSTTRLWAGLGWAGLAQLNVLVSARASQEEPRACLSEKIMGLCIIIPEFNLDSAVF